MLTSLARLRTHTLLLMYIKCIFWCSLH